MGKPTTLERLLALAVSILYLVMLAYMAAGIARRVSTEVEAVKARQQRRRPAILQQIRRLHR
jgi:hypothetical protein